MQSTVPSIRITSLYGSQSSSVVFAFKTATFGAEFQGFMGPRHDLSFCACKTAWLASELLVSMSPSSHVCFWDAKQRLLDQNDKSIWVLALISCLVNANSDFRTRLTCLYGSQTSSVVLSTHNIVLSSIINRLYWCQPSSVCFFHAKQWLYDQTYKSVWVPDLICGFEHT